MNKNDLAQRCYDACNKLTKWRNVFAGWQLGTRLKGDPECDAVRDHREVTILLRAEYSALTKLLLDAKVFTEAEFQQAMIDECAALERDYERKFPGIRAVEDGLQYDRRATETMKGWRP
jgi:hypothetical protein